MSTGIYDAAVFGDMEVVKEIVSQHPEAVNERDEHGFTPLHGLAEEEHVDIAEFLVTHEADVNAANDEGITPLHLAGWPEMATLLLRNGAKLEAQSNLGATPLLVLAAEPEREDVIAVLLEAGASVNAIQNNGRTALDIAISRLEDDKVALLRRYGGKTAAELK
jgi:ankyrin repeat protein